MKMHRPSLALIVASSALVLAGGFRRTLVIAGSARAVERNT
jgi:hypothetical protein